MQIRNAKPNDTAEILRILESAKQSLRALGVDQWQNGYPNEDSIRADIEAGYSRVLEENGILLATAAVYVGHEPTYDAIYGGTWQTQENRYGIIHRIAVAPQARNRGAASALIAYCASLARSENIPSLRCDTHPDNRIMQHTLEKNGYVRCGTIYLADGAVRLGYEKLL